MQEEPDIAVELPIEKNSSVSSLRTKLTIALVLFLFLFGVLNTLFFTIWSQVENEFSLAGGSLRIYQAEIITPLHYSADSVVFIDSSQKIHVGHFRLQLNPLAFSLKSKRFLQIEIDTLVFSQMKGVKKRAEKLDTKKRLSFTDFKMPFNFDIQIDYFEHKLNKKSKTTLSKTRLKNIRARALQLSISKITSSEIKASPHVQVELDWSNSSKVDLDLTLSTKDDHLSIAAQVDKDNLEKASAKVFTSIQSPTTWMPNKMANDFSFLQSLEVQGQIEVDILNQIYDHNLNIKSQINSKFGFPSMKLSLTTEGSLNKFDWTINGLGPKNETVFFKGDLKDLSEVNFTGYTANLYRAMTKYHSLPINFTVNQAKFKNNHLSTKVTTQDGSNLQGKINFGKKDIQGTFNADITSNETWALGWTKDHLQIDGATVEGRFKNSDIVLKAHSSTPNAYGFAAEDVTTEMRIDPGGIYFWNGRIQKRGIPFNFTGKVLWDPRNPHYSFDIQGENNDFIQIFGDYNSNLSVTSSKFDLKHLPLRDSIFHKYNPGKLTGNYQNNFQKKLGQSKVFLESTIAEEPITLQLDAQFIQDTLRLQSAEVVHKQNKISASGDLWFNHTINDSSFHPITFQFQTDSFNLVDFSQGFLNSSIKSGIIDGKIQLKDSSFTGKLTASNIYFNSIDSSNFYIPYMSLEGYNNGLSLVGKSKWGQSGEWDGDFQLILDDILKSQRKLALGYTPDRELLFNQEGIAEQSQDTYFVLETTTQNFNIFQGTAKVIGSWNLPNHIGQLANLDVFAPLNWNRLLGFKGLTLKTDVLDATYLHDEIPETKIKVQTNIKLGHIKSHATILDSLSQQATLSTHYDVNENKLRGFNFDAPQFYFPLDTIQRIYFTNLKGHIEQTGSFVNIHFSSPSSFYKMKSEELGNVNARLININGYYGLPTSQDSKKTYKTRINAQAEVASLLFEKDDYTEKYYDVFNSLVLKKNKKRTGIKKIESKPIELNIDIRDAGYDSLFVKTNLAEFPITTNLQISGTTANPILSGSVQSTSEADLKFEDFNFNIINMGVNWERQSPKEGALDVKLFKQLPFCIKPNDDIEETCPIDIQVNGTLHDPRLSANANCGSNAEINTKQLFASISLGCVSEKDGDVVNFIYNVGTRLASQQFKNLSNNYIRENLIEDLQIHLGSEGADLDSSSIYLETKIPGLEEKEFFEDFRLKGQFVWDAQTEGDYERYQLGGLDYIWFNRINTQTGQFKDGKLSSGFSILNKHYLESEDAQKNEQRLEWNIGTEYQNFFWGDFCLFGHGDCSPALDIESGEELE